jgi:hypothetical protein
MTRHSAGFLVLRKADYFAAHDCFKRQIVALSFTDLRTKIRKSENPKNRKPKTENRKPKTENRKPKTENLKTENRKTNLNPRNPNGNQHPLRR